MKRFIFITTHFEALHQYKQAPEEVAYLRTVHRHRFYVRATIQVFNNDRELEFIMVQHDIDAFIKKSFLLDNAGSCESMAEQLYQYLKAKYHAYIFHPSVERVVQVEVNEDNENGAIIGDTL